MLLAGGSCIGACSRGNVSEVVCSVAAELQAVNTTLNTINTTHTPNSDTFLILIASILFVEINESEPKITPDRA